MNISEPLEVVSPSETPGCPVPCLECEANMSWPIKNISELEKPYREIVSRLGGKKDPANRFFFHGLLRLAMHEACLLYGNLLEGNNGSEYERESLYGVFGNRKEPLWVGFCFGKENVLIGIKRTGAKLDFDLSGFENVDEVICGDLSRDLFDILRRAGGSLFKKGSSGTLVWKFDMPSKDNFVTFQG